MRFIRNRRLTQFVILTDRIAMFLAFCSIIIIVYDIYWFVSIYIIHGPLVVRKNFLTNVFSLSNFE